jgi:hypothetical protein
MSVQEMYDAALAVVAEHNSVVGQGNPGYVDPNQFAERLKASGGTSVDRLKALSYEDIVAAMPSHLGGVKPVALAKDIAKIFRGKEEVANTSQGRPISAKKADKMSLKELVENYDPEEAENPVGKRLKEISRGQKFIVYSSGRTVDVDTTFKLLDEVKKGFPERDSIEINGEIMEVHPVGALPDNFVDENPLYRDRPLRPDGTCDQTNRSWNGVPTRVRQLIRVAMDIGDLKNLSIERVHDIMDMVVEGNAFEKFSKRYQDAAVEFKKREGVGNLPTLKLVLKVEKGAGRANRPFDGAKKVEWIAPEVAKMRNLKAKFLGQSGHAANFNDADTYTAWYKNWRDENDK